MVALEIVQLKTSDMENFSYLLYCPQTREGAIVDPSMRPQLVLDEAVSRKVKVRLLLNTHGHQDHITGNGDILAGGGIQLAAHPDAVPAADIALSEGMQLPIGNSSITVMDTPGHSPGSVVFATADAIISGDTLFVSRCGRADLPGSDVSQLYTSLQRLKQLAPTTRVYPGHDYGPMPSSTIAWELEHNEFIKCPNLESFIALRMG
ncbi:hydroxyacylglutathione hydrolase family protein [Pelovirga terrestris]|uniref:MBL fold metallo-hydrolase n=1 Tax=Pelovirga terrestris TaxID=2771352 RepID=A0A8J6QX48_9BACT|nr:hydroxyacylglutathione hydrolase family protein [Pelovirga terrestris]MBD1400533.1 MBL fold metallo-hydrolase [Pelovirga terrestris]